MEQWASPGVHRLYNDTCSTCGHGVLMEQWASPRVRRLYNDTRSTRKLLVSVLIGTLICALYWRAS